MKNTLLIFTLILTSNLMIAQKTMTPELLWQVERLSVMGLDSGGTTLFFTVKTPNIEDNSYDSKYFKMPVDGGAIVEIKEEDVKATDKNTSADGNYQLFNNEVHIENVKGTDAYKHLDKSDVYIFSDLDIRHWDTWSDGSFNHLFYKKAGSEDTTGIDIMPNEPYHTPQKPFGGDEDYIWSPDSKAIYYVSKKLKGKAYATSTNTDIYKYTLATKTTENITEDNKGYDTNPAFASTGALAWLQMKTDGYESDKNDIIVLNNGIQQNLNCFKTQFSQTVDTPICPNRTHPKPPKGG